MAVCWGFMFYCSQIWRNYNKIITMRVLHMLGRAFVNFSNLIPWKVCWFWVYSRANYDFWYICREQNLCSYNFLLAWIKSSEHCILCYQWPMGWSLPSLISRGWESVWKRLGLGERVVWRGRPGQVLPEDGWGEEFASTRNVLMLRDAEHLSCTLHWLGWCFELMKYRWCQNTIKQPPTPPQLVTTFDGHCASAHSSNNFPLLSSATLHTGVERWT